MWIVWSLSTLVGVCFALSMVEEAPAAVSDHIGEGGPDVVRETVLRFSR